MTHPYENVSISGSFIFDPVSVASFSTASFFSLLSGLRASIKAMVLLVLDCLLALGDFLEDIKTFSLNVEVLAEMILPVDPPEDSFCTIVNN